MEKEEEEEEEEEGGEEEEEGKNTLEECRRVQVATQRVFLLFLACLFNEFYLQHDRCIDRIVVPNRGRAFAAFVLRTSMYTQKP